MLVKENFNFWHAELPTETTTYLVNADLVHNRLLDVSFHFLMILILLVHTVNRFVNVHQFKCELVIISMCFSCFLAKQQTVINWKISIICVSQGSAETLFKWDGKMKQLLIAQSPENYEKQIMLARVTAKMLGMFLRQSVEVMRKKYRLCMKNVNEISFTLFISNSKMHFSSGLCIKYCYNMHRKQHIVHDNAQRHSVYITTAKSPACETNCIQQKTAWRRHQFPTW